MNIIILLQMNARERTRILSMRDFDTKLKLETELTPNPTLHVKSVNNLREGFESNRHIGFMRSRRVEDGLIARLTEEPGAQGHGHDPDITKFKVFINPLKPLVFMKQFSFYPGNSHYIPAILIISRQFSLFSDNY